MKVKFIMGALAAFVLAVGFGVRGSSAIATEPQAAAATAVAVTAVGAEENEFLGSKSCKMCHSKSYKSWEEKAHAKALEPLKPGAAAEEKTKHKLDPAKDYTKDETCLVCHTVGFGKKGGYAIPPEGDEKAAKKAESLAAVGCESCHGPGGGVADIKKDIQKNKRKYKVEELTAHGLVVPTAATCQQCHTETHPTFDPEEKFDFEKMKEKGVHDHEKLDLKEG